MSSVSDFDSAVASAVYSNLGSSEAKKSSSVLAVMLGINMIAYSNFVGKSETECVKNILGDPVVKQIDSYIINYINRGFAYHNTAAFVRTSISTLWDKNVTLETCEKLKSFIETCPMCVIFPDSECRLNNELQMVLRVSVSIKNNHGLSSFAKKKFDALKTRTSAETITVFVISHRACKCLQMLIDSFNTSQSPLLGRQVEKVCTPECPACVIL